MKAIRKESCPELLTSYLLNNPDATWDNFKNDKQDGYRLVKAQIQSDQQGVCCYCEVDFLDSSQDYIEDFRVEHFYPKSLTPLPNGHNAHLEWSNLLGACHGGSNSNLSSVAYFQSRFTAPNLRCDAIKKENNWVNIILNPLEINPNDKIFTFNSQGEILVDNNCPFEVVDQAKNTIDRLNLNQVYLKNARKTIREEILNQFIELTQLRGYDDKVANETLKNMYLSGSVIKFYTCKFDFFS